MVIKGNACALNWTQTFCIHTQPVCVCVCAAEKQSMFYVDCLGQGGQVLYVQPGKGVRTNLYFNIPSVLLGILSTAKMKSSLKKI